MAVLVSIATGNASAAATWGVVDATSYANGELATESLLTTGYNATRSNAFTPGAITISHICVKLCERIGTTGTMSVHLYNNTDLADVAGTEVTIDVADLPSALEADLNGGWIAFKLASPVLLVVAKSYSVEAKTSTGTMVDLWCDTSGDNLSRCLVTTTTAAPAAGDDMIVCGERTGQGTGNDFTVTWNITAATDFGGASTSLVTPALSICDGGTLTWGTTAATNYIMRMSGHIIIYSGGVYNQGTTATPCPRDSSMELQFDCAADGDFGLTVRNLGTCVMKGQSRTSGNNTWYCKLNTDEAIASTSLGVDTDTGWLNGDDIAIASTTRTTADCETVALTAGAGVSTLTVGAIAAAHSGTAGTQAEIILLTRNVRVKAVTSTAVAYIDSKSSSIVDFEWASFQYLGTNVATKYGITCGCITGSFSVRYCSLRDHEAYGFFAAAGLLDNVLIEYNAIWNANSSVASSVYGIYVGSVTTAPTSLTVNGNIVIKVGAATGAGASYAVLAGTFTNNTFVGATGSGINLSATSENIYNFVCSGNVAHSNNSTGLTVGATSRNITFSTMTLWRNNSTGFTLSNASSGNSFLGFVLFGNNSQNIAINQANDAIFRDCVLDSDASFVTAAAIAVSATSVQRSIAFESCTFGVSVNHTQTMVVVSTCMYDLKFTNCTFSDTALFTSLTNFRSGKISSLRHDGVASANYTWKAYGSFTTPSIEIDTTIFNTASPSLKMSPGFANRRLIGPIWEAAVASGNTLTVSVAIRYSVIGDGTAYAGNVGHARLMLHSNHAVGVLTDTVIDTHDGSAGWVVLSGTTAVMTDDAILEFYIDCEGTAGWINVDDFTCVSPDSQGLKFWSAEHGGPLALGQPAGGGGLITSRGMGGGMQ